jgi:hypothetical protein
MGGANAVQEPPRVKAGVTLSRLSGLGGEPVVADVWVPGGLENDHRSAATAAGSWDWTEL